MKYRTEECSFIFHGDAGSIYSPSQQLYNWATNHKTMIVLNGGMNQDLQTMKEFFTNHLNWATCFPIPFTVFHEDEMSLGSILTCVGCVLPEEVYDSVNSRKAQEILGSDAITSKFPNDFFFIKDGEIVAQFAEDCSTWKFITMLKACPLAR